MSKNSDHIYEKFEKNETVYLLNDYEDIALKLVPSKYGSRCYAKSKGRMWEIDWATNLALETRLGGVIITREEYDKY